MIFAVNVFIFALWLVVFTFMPPTVTTWAGYIALAYLASLTLVGEKIVNWIRRKRR